MKTYECEDVEHNARLIDADSPEAAAQEFANLHKKGIDVSADFEQGDVIWFDARWDGELVDTYRVQEIQP